VTAGVEMDVLGIAYQQFSDAQRGAVVAAHPRGGDFKNDIIQAFYDAMKHRPTARSAPSTPTCWRSRTRASSPSTSVASYSIPVGRADTGGGRTWSPPAFLRWLCVRLVRRQLRCRCHQGLRPRAPAVVGNREFAISWCGFRLRGAQQPISLDKSADTIRGGGSCTTPKRAANVTIWHKAPANWSVTFFHVPPLSHATIFGNAG
jgi:hypothetical protein